MAFRLGSPVCRSGCYAAFRPLPARIRFTTSPCQRAPVRVLTPSAFSCVAIRSKPMPAARRAFIRSIAPDSPSTEAVRLAVLTAAFFCPFSKACATQLSEAFTMRVCQKAIAARQQVSVEELDARLSGKVVEMPRRAETA